MPDSRIVAMQWKIIPRIIPTRLKDGFFSYQFSRRKSKDMEYIQ